MTQPAIIRYAGPLTIGLLILLALAPVRYTRLVGDIGAVVETVITPIAGPITSLSRRLTRQESSDPEDLTRLERESERWRTLYFQSQAQNEVLRRQVRQLQQGQALNPLPVQQVLRRVVGTSSSLSSRMLRVRTRASDGVEENTVATVDGIHLLGRVVDVPSPRLCWVRVLTDPASGALEGVVLAGNSPDAPQLACRLRPGEGGTLRGEVEHRLDPGTQQPIEIEPGAQVRLADETWPRSSQRLVIGTVERIEPAPNQPLRRIVVVRPAVDLDRVTEVVLRIVPGEGPDGAGAGEGGAG